MEVVPAVDWEQLRTAAREAMTHAYAPYSHFPVGVAGLVDAADAAIGERYLEAVESAIEAIPLAVGLDRDCEDLLVADEGGRVAFEAEAGKLLAAGLGSYDATFGLLAALAAISMPGLLRSRARAADPTSTPV